VCWKREYLRVIGGQARLTGSDLLAMNVETGQLAHRELRADVAVELNAMFSIAARSCQRGRVVLANPFPQRFQRRAVHSL
jgi:hypothetical protein